MVFELFDFKKIFSTFSICFILIAVLIGFNLARRLSKPITNLIDSANEISKGNFDAKVSEDDQFDEIKVLLTSYNKMINEIQLKQNQILAKSEEDESKRIFIEAILSLLTTGVISLDRNLNINLLLGNFLKLLSAESVSLSVFFKSVLINVSFTGKTTITATIFIKIKIINTS